MDSIDKYEKKRDQHLAKKDRRRLECMKPHIISKRKYNNIRLKKENKKHSNKTNCREYQEFTDKENLREIQYDGYGFVYCNDNTYTDDYSLIDDYPWQQWI